LSGGPCTMARMKRPQECSAHATTMTAEIAQAFIDPSNPRTTCELWEGHEGPHRENWQMHLDAEWLEWDGDGEVRRVTVDPCPSECRNCDNQCLLPIGHTGPHTGGDDYWSDLGVLSCEVGCPVDRSIDDGEIFVMVGESLVRLGDSGPDSAAG